MSNPRDGRWGRPIRTLAAALTLVGVAVAPAGCSRKVPPSPIEGTVKLDGKPLAEATVMFWSTDDDPEARGRYAIGTTDSEGHFTVKNAGSREGLEPGRYKVTFSKVVGPNGKVIVAAIKPVEAGVKTTKQVIPEALPHS